MRKQENGLEKIVTAKVIIKENKNYVRNKVIEEL